jgi:hypothetical protein
MGARALEFGHAHPLESAGYAATMVRLEERLGRADMLATQQRDGILAVRAATGHKRELVGKMRRAHLTHLARIAEEAGSELPELPQKFLLKPGKGSYRAFRTAARGMQVEAQGLRQELVKHGLVEPLLDDLGRLLDEFDAVVERGQEARRVHVGASAQLKVVADEVVRLVNGPGVGRARGDGGLSRRICCSPSTATAAGCRSLSRPRRFALAVRRCSMQ